MLIGAVVGVLISSVAAGDGLDQIPVFISAGIFLQAAGGDTDEVAVAVILHGLGRFPNQGNIIEVCHIGIAFVCAHDPDLGNGLCAFLRNDRHADELPGIGEVRIERYILGFGRIVGVGNNGTQAAFLRLAVQILCGILVIIRDCVRVYPAGENVGLCSRQVQSHILISVCALIRRIAIDPDGVRRSGYTLTGIVRCAGTHRPAIAGGLHVAVFQQIIAGGCLRFFYLDIVRIEGADASAVENSDAVNISCRCGKADADTHPAVIDLI